MDSLPERVYFQYRSKPKCVQWFDISKNVGQVLYDAFGEIRDSYDIDTAVGAQLDIIATIVGTDRAFIRGQALGVVQFSKIADSDDVQFSIEADADDVQFSAGTISDDEQLSDEYLRRLIRWKIAGNNSHATIEHTLAALQIVMPDKQVSVVDPEDMTFSLLFHNGPPDTIDALILSDKDVVPRPQGVKYTGYTDQISGVFYNGYQ